MLKKLLFLSIISLQLHADMISYYKIVLERLQYDKNYNLYKTSQELSQQGVSYSRYANFAIDASYGQTSAKILANPFSSTDIVLSNTLDLFGKKTYEIELISLDIKAKKSILQSQKEQLFISLVDVIFLYYKTKDTLLLHQNIYGVQKNIYHKLEKLHLSGAISKLDVLRFKNRLIFFQTKMIAKKSEVKKIKNQLSTYAPKEHIPSLDSQYIYTKDDFLSKNPSLSLNKIAHDKLLLQAESSQNSYLPEVNAALAYQKIDDPTSYGDNYSVRVGMHMPLNSAIFKKTEALRVNALSQKSKNIKYKTARENEYIQLYKDYKSALEQSDLLYKNLADYEQSQETIKIAFLKGYVDFNSYIQVLTQTLQIKEKLVILKYQAYKEATILNGISSGVIYE